MTPWKSTVPDAMAALMRILPAWPDLAGVDVRMAGQPPTESGTAAVFIGDTQQLDDAGQPVETAVDFAETSEGLGGNRTREIYSIHCCAAVLNGDDNWTQASNDAYALASAAGAAIQAHSNGLAGSIQGMAGVSGGSLRFVKQDVGIKAVVLFDVDVSAYTPG